MSTLHRKQCFFHLHRQESVSCTQNCVSFFSLENKVFMCIENIVSFFCTDNKVFLCIENIVSFFCTDNKVFLVHRKQCFFLFLRQQSVSYA